VDFVFNNGAGTWDNNGGADWHVTVANPCTSTPPFTMDGTLDAGVPAVATCGGQTLYAKYDGRWLYLAGPAGRRDDQSRPLPARRAPHDHRHAHRAVG
jgi:hypothetical protein